MNTEEFKKYLISINAQKKIDKLAKIYKNKKIVIYGAGSFSQTIFENFNLSKLNIIAIADIKYSINNSDNYYGLKCINPSELGNIDCDTILIANYDCSRILTKLDDEILYLTKNENVEIRPLIKLTFKDLFL